MQMLDMQALLAESTIKHLEADCRIMLQQLEERKPLAQLLAAVDADDPAAKSRLLSLSKASILDLMCQYNCCDRCRRLIITILSLTGCHHHPPFRYTDDALHDFGCTVNNLPHWVKGHVLYCVCIQEEADGTESSQCACRYIHVLCTLHCSASLIGSHVDISPTTHTTIIKHMLTPDVHPQGAPKPLAKRTVSSLSGMLYL